MGLAHAAQADLQEKYGPRPIDGQFVEAVQNYQYGVSPLSIERVNYLASSNLVWNFAYGKFAFFESNIRYFRSGLLLGPALVVTNTESIPGFCIGWTIETFVNERTAWKFQIRDNYAIGNSHPNNLVFVLGTSYGF